MSSISKYLKSIQIKDITMYLKDKVSIAQAELSCTFDFNHPTTPGKVPNLLYKKKALLEDANQSCTELSPAPAPVCFNMENLTLS